MIDYPSEMDLNYLGENRCYFFTFSMCAPEVNITPKQYLPAPNRSKQESRK